MKMKIKYKFLLFVFVLASYYLLTTSYCLYAQDKIIAIVNHEAITQKDLSDFLNFMRLQFAREYKGKEVEEKVQKVKVALLSRLIEDRLILQEAKKSNIPVDENRIRAKINEVKKEYPSDTLFQSELMKQGLTQGDIEKKIREQSMMFSIVEQKVRSKVIIKPEEVTVFYEENKRDIHTPEEKIFEALSLEDYDTARNVANELKAGKKPEDLISQYPLTVNILTVISGDEVRKEIVDTASNLGLGEASNPVKIEDKYYVFRLRKIVPPKNLTLTEAQAKIHALLFEKKMQEGLARWLDELKKNSYIKIVQD
ncbi:MAG: peptidyl-prolyl cis-trans isomerase [Candidatus Omnitrophica bacterium]|nr:peptidyl-prolyl cis-trans isomerase [Candidatus Omnitrophota bacterium]